MGRARVRGTPRAAPRRVRRDPTTRSRESSEVISKLSTGLAHLRVNKQRARNADREAAKSALRTVKFTPDLFDKPAGKLSEQKQIAISACVAKHVAQSPELRALSKTQFSGILETITEVGPGLGAHSMYRQALDAVQAAVAAGGDPTAALRAFYTTRVPAQVNTFLAMHHFLADLAKRPVVPAPGVTPAPPFPEDNAIAPDIQGLGPGFINRMSTTPFYGQPENAGLLRDAIAQAAHDAKNASLLKYDAKDAQPDSSWTKLEDELKTTPLQGEFETKFTSPYAQKKFADELKRKQAEIKAITVEIKEARDSDKIGDSKEDEIIADDIEELSGAIDKGRDDLAKLIKAEAHAKAIADDITELKYTPAPGAPQQPVDPQLAQALGTGLALIRTDASPANATGHAEILAADGFIVALTRLMLGPPPPPADPIVLGAAIEAAATAAKLAVIQSPGTPDDGKKYFAFLAAQAAYNNLITTAMTPPAPVGPGAPPAPTPAEIALNPASATAAAAAGHVAWNNLPVLGIDFHGDWVFPGVGRAPVPGTHTPQEDAIRGALIGGDARRALPPRPATGVPPTSTPTIPGPPDTAWVDAMVDQHYAKNLRDKYKRFSDNLIKEADEIDRRVSLERINRATGTPTVRLIGQKSTGGPSTELKPYMPGWQEVDSGYDFLIQTVPSSSGGPPEQQFSWDFGLREGKNIITAKAILNAHQRAKGNAPFYFTSINSYKDVDVFLKAVEEKPRILKKIILTPNVDKQLQIGWFFYSKKDYNNTIRRIEEHNNAVEIELKAAEELKATPYVAPLPVVPPPPRPLQSQDTREPHLFLLL